MSGKTFFDSIGAPYRLQSGSIRTVAPVDVGEFAPATRKQVGAGFDAKSVLLSRHSQIMQIVHHLRTGGFAGVAQCSSAWETGEPIEVTVDQDTGGWLVAEL